MLITSINKIRREQVNLQKKVLLGALLPDVLDLIPVYLLLPDGLLTANDLLFD